MNQEDIIPASDVKREPEFSTYQNPEYIGALPHMEIKPLFISGPSHNRVDLVFFSDGYQENEKDKFFNDAYRLAHDMSHNQTFATVNPLLNFWAAFTASPESGIGVGGTPRNTTYGLYRDGTELRAVYCSKLATARAAAISLGSQCDYPILLGNDPLYGGLGGEFTQVSLLLLYTVPD
ncbi:hypothetical protein FRC02_010162 [Tulasnella sp. 418]|nr:hypothetical protein FRC02_010162 [Tulasnella sp. 418]